MRIAGTGAAAKPRDETLEIRSLNNARTARAQGQGGRSRPNRNDFKN
jgi:hypothetical protein